MNAKKALHYIQREERIREERKLALVAVLAKGAVKDGIGANLKDNLSSSVMRLTTKML
jgi:hypothetical protein